MWKYRTDGLRLAAFLVASANAASAWSQQPAEVDLRKVPALAPESFHPAAGTTLKLGLTDLTAAQGRLIWPAGETRRFVQRSNGAQENRDTLPANAGDSYLTTTPTIPAGTTLLGVDLATRTAAVDVEKFREFLQQHTSDDAAKLNAKTPSVQIRLHSSCKAILHTPGVSGGSAAVCEKAGLRGEITPLSDPSVIPLGSDLPLKAALEGSGAKHVRIVLMRPDGETKTMITDDNSAVNITIDKPGIWSLQFQHALPAPPETGVDWDVFVSTLRFEVAPQEAGK